MPSQRHWRSTDAGAPRDTRIYDLSTANAAELATTVRSLYLDQAKTRPAAQPQETLILPDGTSNRLIVAGATNELNVVEDIIKKLDKVSSQSGTARKTSRERPRWIFRSNCCRCCLITFLIEVLKSPGKSGFPRLFKTFPDFLDRVIFGHQRPQTF